MDFENGTLDVHDWLSHNKGRIRHTETMTGNSQQCAVLFFFFLIFAAVAWPSAHPCLQRGALSFPVDVTVKAVDSGAHHTVFLVTAHGVDVSELTGQWRHFVIIANARVEKCR